MAGFYSLWLVSLTLLACTQVRGVMKDFLFIAVDDLRAQLGCYGDMFVKTPHIDQLATKSMLFERAYCQVAICSPSRTSLLTGRRPDTNHSWRNYVVERWRNFTNATSLPQYFKENGYRTIGMGKVFHPGTCDSNDAEYSWSLPYFEGKDNVTANHTSWHCFENISDSDLRDGLIADNAVETLKEIKRNRTKGDKTPFFVAVGFHKPHLPFYAPSKYFDLYPPADKIPLPPNPNAPKFSPPIAWSAFPELKAFSDMKVYDLPECMSDPKAWAEEKCSVSDSDTRLLRRAYHAAQSYADAQVGKVLAELEDQDLGENTITVFWGDHGWKIGEHKMWAKHTNFEDDTHVPFMIRVPGVTDSGMRTDALVELIDIFPSLTELAGLPVPPLCPEGNKDLLTCVEGTSFIPLLKDPKQEWKKAAFSQYPRPADGLTQIPGKPPFQHSNHAEDVMGYAIRVDTYRFVEWYSFNRTTAKPDFSTIWGTELYDHSMPAKSFNDENEDLAEQEDMADKVKELRKMLQKGWRAAMPPGKRHS